MQRGFSATGSLEAGQPVFGNVYFLSTDDRRVFDAPLPGLGVIDAEGGFVFPDGFGGGPWVGVGVVGGGVGDEVDVAAAAVHVDFAGVEEFGEAFAATNRGAVPLE